MLLCCVEAKVELLVLPWFQGCWAVAHLSQLSHPALPKTLVTRTTDANIAQTTRLDKYAGACLGPL